MVVDVLAQQESRMIVRVSLTKQESEQAMRAAQRIGLSISQWIKFAAFNTPETLKIPITPATPLRKRSWRDVTQEERIKLAAEWMKKIPLPHRFIDWDNETKIKWLDRSWPLGEAD